MRTMRGAGFAFVTMLAMTAAPGIAQARDIMIFFDWGKANVSPIARTLVGIAKKEIGPASTVTIAGHTDASEPVALSEKRAAAIRNALVKMGVPKTARVTVVGRGAEAPLVQTGAGAREPQNRRVEISVK